jgi:arsenate reductase
MSLRIYAYQNCDTCRRALKWLAAQKIDHEVIPIREKPPTVAELKTMLGRVGELRRLFNTSGQDYKAMNMKERLPKLSESEALTLLAANGNLVKRPFAIGKSAGTTGFDEDEWKRMFARR